MEPERPFEHAEANEISALAATDPGLQLNIRDHMALMQEYRAAVREMEARVENLCEECRLQLRHSPVHGVTSRIKTPTSLIEKLRRRNLPMTADSIRANITDVAGVRIVCNYLSDIEDVASMLLDQDDMRLIARKDYVANPKPTGYRSLHLVVAIPVHVGGAVKSVPVEVQIRTIAMEYWASLEHRLRYKNHGVLDEMSDDCVRDIRARLVACAEQIAAVDRQMQRIREDIDTLCAEQEEARETQRDA